MAVECLHAKVGPDVPKWNGLIACTGNKHAGVWLPLHRVYRVNMPSESETALFWDCKIPKLNWVIHGARDQEIPTVMEVTPPYWLSMLRVCGLALGVNKVPDLDTSISWGCGQVVAFWVEAYSSNPVLMALTTHDQVTTWDRPQFPGGVVWASCKDVLLWVIREAGHSHQVTFERLHWVHVGVHWLEFFHFHRIWWIDFTDDCLLWHWTKVALGGLRNSLFLFESSSRRILSSGTASHFGWHICLSWRALKVKLALFTWSSTTCFILDLSQARFKVLNLGSKPIFFKLHEHFLLDCTLILVWQCLKSVLVALVFIFKFPNVVVQLLFLLLNPSMVDFLEISLLSELVIGWSGLLSNNTGLINLFLELG